MTVLQQNDSVIYKSAQGKDGTRAQLVSTINVGSVGPDGTVTTSSVVSYLDANNATTTPLTSGATYTGTATNINRYSTIAVQVFTDQASATDGLSIQQSNDGTNWDIRDTYTVPAMAAGQGKTYAVQAVGSQYRIVYTNGATPQTAFRLWTKLLIGTNPSNSVRPQDGYSNENDMQQNQAFNMLWNGTSWDRQVTPASVGRLVSAAASTNATNLKTSAGRVHFISGYNAAAALRYIKLYNKASTPTVGTDTPFYGAIPLPAAAAFTISIPQLYFPLGIGYGLTVNAADSDTTALTAGDITGFMVTYS